LKRNSVRFNSICVVGGLGNMGSKHYKKLLSRKDNSLVLDIHDINHPASKDLSEYDAIIIATPSDTHYGLAKTAIENGQNVLVEKPVALNYKEAQTLYRLAKEYNVVYVSGHTMRYNPEFRKALPELYHTKHLHFEMHVPHDNSASNAVFDLMVHGFELAFNVGQREFNREFQLLSCETQDSWVSAEAIIGSKICTFEVSYKSDRDIRRLHAWDPKFVVDFHTSDGKQPDALSNLHDHFIKLCNVSAWTDQAEPATASIQLCEQVTQELFYSE